MKKVSLLLAMLSIIFAVSCKKDTAPAPEPTPVPAGPTDLSAAGSANCYIVSAPGSYTFKAVKGNSTESVGVIEKVTILWESYGTNEMPSKGSLIKEVAVSGENPGVITFSTPETLANGNALIAAKDASNNILWSWHIWFCKGYDAQATAQVYDNASGTMMDRNLGATSATPGEVGALGLLYQWGRKDPFLGSSSINTLTPAKATSNFYPVESDASTGTVPYATANPTTFITASSDWLNTQNDKLWDYPKSIYDPCPPGWQVPYYTESNKLIWLKASEDKTNTCTFDETSRGIDFTGKFGNATHIWYPAAGYLSYDSGDLSDVGESGSWWSCGISGTNAACLYIEYDNINDMMCIPTDRVFGLSVRCCKE